ncbi:MAG: ABC transporter permease [Gemmatimonadota bacterium]
MRAPLTERLVAAVLRLAPRPFRDRFAGELLATHRARAAERGGVAFALREVAGAVAAVLRLRVGGRSGFQSDGSRSTTRAEGQLAGMLRDLGLAGRGLRRAPGFAVAAVLVTGLGIGASTAIFSALNAFLFRPLPMADSDRLVLVYETNPEFDWTHETAAPANALDWADQVEAFSAVALYSSFTDELTWLREGEPQLLTVVLVSGNFFDVLGVPPAAGRVFRPEESWADGAAENRVVISHAMWQRYFAGDPAVAGRTLELASGVRAEVVGVAPEGFSFPSDGADLWAPWGWDPAAREAVWFRRAHFVRPVARLTPGVSMTAADAQLQTVVGRLQTAYPETNRVMGAGLMPLRDFLVMDVRTSLEVLAGAVLLLMVLAAVNVATLVLLRSGDRTREVALRHALGAGRWRVVRHLAAEGLVLGGVAAALGLAAGVAGVTAVGRLTRLGIDGATAPALDVRVVAFATGLGLLCAILFTLIPAARLWRVPARAALSAAGARGASRGRQGTRALRALVTAEVALGLLLVAGAVLMVRTFQELRQVDAGFRAEGVLAVQLTVPTSRYPERAHVLAFQRDLLAALEGRAGIERAGMVQQLPLGGPGWSSQFQARGWPPERVGLDIVHRRADRGYFEALDIPLVRGRLFEASDGSDTEQVVLVNERFAAMHFPGEDPIGQYIAYDREATEASTWRRIIGIVGDHHQTSVREPPRAEVFEHPEQSEWSRTNWYVVRGAGAAAAHTANVRAVLSQLDPLVPLEQVRTLREVRRAAMATDELVLVVLTVFGFLALVLATVGVYGVTAQAARRRTREIGIRMAVGADGGQVLRLVLLQGAGTVVAGILLGLAAALLLTRAMSGLLYGVTPTDPATLAVVAAVLAGAALVAMLVPALRAARVDPGGLLRAE